MKLYSRLNARQIGLGSKDAAERISMVVVNGPMLAVRSARHRYAGQLLWVCCTYKHTVNVQDSSPPDVIAYLFMRSSTAGLILATCPSECIPLPKNNPWSGVHKATEDATCQR